MKTSIIIPASNEAAWISHCLEAVFASKRLERAQVIVVANGCQDNTADVARRYSVLAEELGWELNVIELTIGDKLKALNAGDRAAKGDVLVYLDADVRVDDRLLHQIEHALDRASPAWASGKLQMAAASRVSRAYARFWSQVPFMAKGVPGAGIFAVNRAGRDRWDAFPEIISDDIFVRLNFAPKERLGVPAGYIWPVAEGWSNLIKVRRRQNAGVAQIEELYPELLANEDKRALGSSGILMMAARDPFGFFVYASVALIVKLTKDKNGSDWRRGR
jgi:glycosyltransferase involved in cell wall biosynthesis